MSHDNPVERTDNNSSGVQRLIDKICDEGVKAAQEESGRVLNEARQKAAAIVAEAKSEADALRARERSEIDAYRKASLEALQLAARDTVLDLKARVQARFEEFVKRLVVSAVADKELVRNLVLVLAGHAADEFIRDKAIQVRLSEALMNGSPDPVLKQEGKMALLGLTSDMLREGIQLVADDEVQGGARVRLVQDKLEIDLSDRVVSRLISQRLVPRFKAVMDGVE